MKSPLLAEAKRLYDLGFGIHWIKERSKAPVKAGWTTGPREIWESLEKGYNSKLNLGTRLGKSSRIGDLYLGVVDCDVKSSEVRHQNEMLKRRAELFPDLPENSARVLTGRGNGSSHIYILTSTPATPRRLAQSPDKVKVLMPSSEKWSKADEKALSTTELKAGWRMRPAWEIALMGEGQQVVIPPSIHQDTGERYEWQLSLRSGADIWVLDLAKLPMAEKVKAEKEIKNDFKLEDVDLILLPDDLQKGITDGEDVEDRSAFIFKVAIRMVKLDFTDNEIATLLTDPDTFAGRASYEHAKTESRARAAQWILDYTVRKARRECDAANIFDREVEVIPLTDFEAALQQKEVVESLDWRVGIERNSDKGQNAGKPKNTLKNVKLILTKVVNDQVFRHNEFTAQDVYGASTPWGGKKNDEITDTDFVRIKDWLSNNFRFEPTTDRIVEAIVKLADENKFHPVREYLRSLEWDGESRLDTWLRVGVNARGPEPYLRAVSQLIILAMVARVERPGIKFDLIPVLEGKQGIGKSSAARILAGDDWFADNLPDLKHPDARLNLRGKLVVEMPELANLKRGDLETVKAFITSQSDRVRAPYGRKPMDLKRQSVFIGTTNESVYLKDKTGNRRYLPVEVGQCDFKWLKDNRDQLFAEAFFIWENERPNLWLEGEAKAQAEELQGARVGEDLETLMHEEFDDFVADQMKKIEGEKFDFSSFSVAQLFGGFGAFKERKPDMTYLLIATKILKSHGFEKYGSQGKSKWRLQKSLELPTIYPTTYPKNPDKKPSNQQLNN